MRKKIKIKKKIIIFFIFIVICKFNHRFLKNFILLPFQFHKLFVKNPYLCLKSHFSYVYIKKKKKNNIKYYFKIYKNSFFF
jgi:hypothetical protein